MRTESGPEWLLRIACTRLPLEDAVGHRAPPADDPLVAVAQGSGRAFASDGRVAVPIAGAGVVVGRAEEPDLALLDCAAAVLGAIAASSGEVERLRHEGEVTSQFVALASHELRGPVGVVHGIGSTLHQRGDDLPDEQAARLRRSLVEQTEHMSQLVHQLLDLSRLDAYAIRLERESFHVRSRVEEIVRVVAPDRRNEVEVDIPRELEATADPAAVDRIVSNLVANALRYGEPPVRVTARARDAAVRLVVEDRGEGIPPEFLPHLFERFSRRDDDGAGTGLGLAIAQSYAHAHGGDLHYEPAEPHGARFELVLPVPG